MSFTLQFSRTLASLLLLAHAFTLLLSWLIHGHFLVQISLSLLILLSLLRYRTLWYGDPHIAFTLAPERHITLFLRKGEQLGEVHSHTVVTAYFVLLRVKLASRRYATLPIFYDALPADTFRALRVKLKFTE